MPAAAATASCPVCAAGFRGTAECPRCGADLRALMELVAGAWALRRRARAALHAGDFRGAARLGEAAADLHCTDDGAALALVARACKSAGSGARP